MESWERAFKDRVPQPHATYTRQDAPVTIRDEAAVKDIDTGTWGQGQGRSRRVWDSPSASPIPLCSAVSELGLPLPRRCVCSS